MDGLLTNATSTDKETAIFGLRYLEEEAAEIHDVIGCYEVSGTCTACTDDGESSEIAFESA